MKAIILAGGMGTRLYPATRFISKQILPIYDKPTIYYPLSVLMLAGIRDILILSTSQDIILFQKLLEDGKNFGLRISYEIQPEPNGLAEAFLIGENFIGQDSCALILGDNIFYGHGFTGMLEMAVANQRGATIFGYYVNNPKEFGVVEFDENGKVISLEEKPKKPKSNYVIPGLYFLDSTVIEKAKRVHPSERGELEMIDILKQYLEENMLHIINMGRGMTWLDTGTHDGMLEASNFIKTIQSRQGIMIACLEEIAYRKAWIGRQELRELAIPLMKSGYGKYLLSLIGEK